MQTIKYLGLTMLLTMAQYLQANPTFPDLTGTWVRDKEVYQVAWNGSAFDMRDDGNQLIATISPQGGDEFNYRYYKRKGKEHYDVRVVADAEKIKKRGSKRGFLSKIAGPATQVPGLVPYTPGVTQQNYQQVPQTVAPTSYGHHAQMGPVVTQQGYLTHQRPQLGHAQRAQVSHRQAQTFPAPTQMQHARPQVRSNHIPYQGQPGTIQPSAVRPPTHSGAVAPPPQNHAMPMGATTTPGYLTGAYQPPPMTHHPYVVPQMGQYPPGYGYGQPVNTYPERHYDPNQDWMTEKDRKRQEKIKRASQKLELTQLRSQKFQAGTGSILGAIGNVAGAVTGVNGIVNSASNLLGIAGKK